MLRYWERIQDRVDIELHRDYDLEYNRFYCASHPLAPVYLWLGLDDPDSLTSPWHLGYAQQAKVELLPCDLGCFVKGPTGMGRLNRNNNLLPEFLAEMIPSMQSWAASSDWEDEEGMEFHLVQNLARKWSSVEDFFEAGLCMQLSLDEEEKAKLASQARTWNGDLDRLVHECYTNLNYRSSPDHIRDYLEQILPDLL